MGRYIKKLIEDTSEPQNEEWDVFLVVIPFCQCIKTEKFCQKIFGGKTFGLFFRVEKLLI